MTNKVTTPYKLLEKRRLSGGKNGDEEERRDGEDGEGFTDLFAAAGSAQNNHTLLW